MTARTAHAQRRNQSVQKAAAVLRAAAGAPEGVTVSELARRAGLPRATALRMVEGLVAERFLRRLPDERVALGSGLLGIARAADPEAILLEAAEQPLAELAAHVPETITLTLSRPDGSLEIVRQLDGPRMLGLTNWVGRPFPVHASSSGKLALALGGEPVRRRLPARLVRHASRTITRRRELDAELVRVEERGYAEIVDELEDGLAAVSVPVTLDGELVASINASGPTVRFDDAARERALPSLRRAAASVERRLVSVVE
jgi:DNA-binding IclR family transcriptional regulator